MSYIAVIFSTRDIEISSLRQFVVVACEKGGTEINRLFGDVLCYQQTQQNERDLAKFSSLISVKKIQIPFRVRVATFNETDSLVVFYGGKN